LVIELQGDANDLKALFMQQRGRDGAVDAARHGDDDARIFGIFVKAEGVHVSFACLPFFKSLNIRINIKKSRIFHIFNAAIIRLAFGRGICLDI
jgi:hypothetical protein